MALTPEQRARLRALKSPPLQAIQVDPPAISPSFTSGETPALGATATPVMEEEPPAPAATLNADGTERFVPFLDRLFPDAAENLSRPATEDVTGDFHSPQQTATLDETRESIDAVVAPVAEVYDRSAEAYRRADRNTELDIELSGLIAKPFMDDDETIRRVKEIQDRRKAELGSDPKEAAWYEKVAGLLGGMEDPVQRGAAAAATGAAIGAATGPGSIFTATGGFGAGSLTAWGQQGAGAVFADLIEEGVSPDTARIIAPAAGAIYGGVEALQFGRFAKYFPMPDAVRQKLIGATQGLVGKIATKVSKRIAKRQPNVVGRGTGKTAKAAIEVSANTGVQVAQEIGQEIIQLGAKDLGVYWEKEGLGREEFLEPYKESVVGVFKVANALAILSGASYGVGKGLQRRANIEILKNREVSEKLGVTEDMTRGEALSYLGDLTPDERNERLGGDEEVVQEEAQEEAQEEGISQVELENMRDEIRDFRSLGDEDKKNALRILDEVTAAGDRKDFSDFHSKFDRYREQDRAGRDTTVRKNARISFIRAEGEVGFEADLMDSGGNPTGSRVTVEAGGRGTLAKITDKNNTVVKTLNQSSYADVIEMLQGGTEQGSLIVNEDNIELDRELNQGPLGPEATPEQGKRKRRRNQWFGKDAAEREISKKAGRAETVELEGPEIGKDVSASAFLKNELGRAKRTNDLQERRDIMRGLQERIVNDDGLTQELLDLAVSKGMGPEATTPMPELDTESIARTKATREAIETRESEQRQLMGIPEPTSTPRPPSAMQEMESVVGTPLKEEVEEIDGGSGGPRTYSEGEPVPEPVQIGSSLPAPEGSPATNIKDSEVSRPRRASGHNVVVGKNVKDARTLGHAVEPLRNTRSEWTYLVIRDKDSGEILGIDAHSWLLPGQTMGMEQILEARGGDKRNDKKIAEQMRQRIARLKSRTKTTGTLTIDVVHNHPSGTATPSDTDITTNSEFVEFIDTIEGAEFGEHTIIDTGEATSIDRNGEWRLYDIYSNEELYTSEQKRGGEEDRSKSGRAERREQDPLYGAYRRNEGLESLFRTFGDAKGEGQKIGNYTNAEIGKYLKNDQGELGLAVIIDSRSNLRSAIPFNIGLLEDDDSFKVWARNRRAEHGGRNLVVYYGADDAESQLGLEEFEQRVQSKIESGDIYDAVYTKGRSARRALEEARGSLAPPLPVGADDDTASVRAVIREEIEDDGVLAAATEGEATTPEALDAASKVVDEVNEEAVPATKIPKKVERIYKLVNENEKAGKQPDKPYALYVYADNPFEVGEWFSGKIGPKKLNEDGSEYLDKDGQPRVAGKLDKMAFRPGLHATDVPVSTHIGGIGVKKGTAAFKRIKARKAKEAAKTGQPIETAWYRKPWQVWYEGEVGADVDWQEEANRRGTNEDGKFEPLRAHITDELPKGGHYKYKTNSNMKSSWIISGEMKLNRRLEAEESPNDLPDLPTFIDNENLAWKELDNKAMETLEVWYPEKFSQMEGVTKKARAKKKGGSLREDVIQPLSDEVGVRTPYLPLDSDWSQVEKEIKDKHPEREVEFQQWFKDSKAVDEEGLPLVMYHGTPSAGFDIFDVHGSNFGMFGPGSYFTSKPTVARGYGRRRSRNRQGNRGVYPVYVSVQNPMVMEAEADLNLWAKTFQFDLEEFMAEVEDQWGGKVLDRSPTSTFAQDSNADPGPIRAPSNAIAFNAAVEMWAYEGGIPTYEVSEILTEGLTSMGYDGITHVGGGLNKVAGTDRPPHTVFIAWEPGQVKSAIANQGTYSTSEQSILREDVDRPGLTPPPGTEPVDAGAIPESVTLGDPMREANFRKWFKNSAVSTPEGAPIVFYHGTRSSRPFEEFGVKQRHPLVAGEKERSANEMGYHFGPIDQANWMALAKKSDNELAPRPQVFPVYLSIQNPLRVEDRMAFNALGYYGVLDRIRYNDTDIDMNDPEMRNLFEDASKAIRKLGYEHSEAARGPDGPLLAGFTGNHENIILQKALQKAGYDGLVYLNRGEGVQLKGTGENITASQIMADSYIEETYREGTDQEFLEVFDASDAYIAFEPTQVKSATGNRGTFSDSEASILREEVDDLVEWRSHEDGDSSEAPLFYNQLLRTINEKMPKRAPKADVLGMIKKTKTSKKGVTTTVMGAGLKVDQLEDVEFEKWLSGQPDIVKKEDVLDYIQENTPKMAEQITTSEGGTKKWLLVDANYGDTTEYDSEQDAQRALESEEEEILRTLGEGYEVELLESAETEQENAIADNRETFKSRWAPGEQLNQIMEAMKNWWVDSGYSDYPGDALLSDPNTSAEDRARIGEAQGERDSATGAFNDFNELLSENLFEVTAVEGDITETSPDLMSKMVADGKKAMRLVSWFEEKSPGFPAIRDLTPQIRRLAAKVQRHRAGYERPEIELEGLWRDESGWRVWDPDGDEVGTYASESDAESAIREQIVEGYAYQESLPTILDPDEAMDYDEETYGRGQYEEYTMEGERDGYDIISLGVDDPVLDASPKTAPAHFDMEPGIVPIGHIRVTHRENAWDTKDERTLRPVVFADEPSQSDVHQQAGKDRTSRTKALLQYQKIELQKLLAQEEIRTGVKLKLNNPAHRNRYEMLKRQANMLLWPDERAEMPKVARDYGYFGDEANNHYGFGNIPFKRSWPELLFKRGLAYTIQKGGDAFAWPATKEQVEQIEGWGHLNDDPEKGDVDPKMRIVRRYTSELPKFAAKYLKQIDPEAVPRMMTIDNEEVWGVPITEKVKEHLTEKGQSLYEDVDPLPSYMRPNESYGTKEKGIPQKPGINTTEKHFATVDELKVEYPNPLIDEGVYNKWFSKLVGGKDKENMGPPAQAIEWANVSETASEYLKARLRPEMQAAADEGLSYAAERMKMYHGGEMTVYDTAHHALWNILSSSTSPYFQESAYLDTLTEGKLDSFYKIIDVALNSEGKDLKEKVWKRWAEVALPAGSPGKSTTHNMSRFFDTFLTKATKPIESGEFEGEIPLRLLHEWMSDPSLTGREIRRLYFKAFEGAGMDNKLVSFYLLTSGHNDLLVLDRVQTRNMWGGRTGLVDFPPGVDAYDVMSPSLTGPRGVAVYEALEDAMIESVAQAYTEVGRPESGTLAQFHWESYSIAGQMAVAHSTLGTSVDVGRERDLDDAIQGRGPIQGKFNTYQTGFSYEPTAEGEPRFYYAANDGFTYIFNRKQFDDFQKTLKAQAKAPRTQQIYNYLGGGRGLPSAEKAISHGFKVSEEQFDAEGKQLNYLERLELEEPGAKGRFAKAIRKATPNRVQTSERLSLNYSSGLREDVDPLKSDEDPSFQETFERFFDRYNIANTEAGVEAEPTEAPADPERAQPLGSEELSFPKTLESAGRPAPQDESRYYIPKSNAETRANVIKAFNKGGDVAVETLMKESESAESTAAAIFLHAYHMDRAGKAPDEESRNQELEKAVNVAAEASERLKDAGQKIQAASMLGMLDPDTIGLFVQRRIDRLNRKEGLGEVTTLADKAAQSKLGKALGLDKSREKRILTAEANKRLKILATKAQVLTDLGADSEALQGALDDLVENQQLSPEQVDQIGDFRTKVRNHLDSGEEVAEVGRSASKEPTMGWRKVLRTKVANRSSEARERLRDMGVLRAGIPADAMADLVAIGIEKMFRLGEGYSSWEQEMRSDLAMEMTKGDLHKIYDAAQKEYGETKKEARREYAQLKKMDEFLEKVAADPGLQESADIAALVGAVGSLGDLAEGARTEVGQEIQSMLRRLEPRRFTEYWTTFLHIGRLLSFKTPLRNILGNALMYEAERMNMMMAASIDKGVSAVTGADRRVMYVGRASSILSPVDFIRGVPKYGITPRGLAENFAATSPELAEGMRAGWMGTSPAGLPTTAELPEGLTFDRASEDYKHLNRLLKPFYAMTGGLEGAMGAQLRGFDFAAYMRAYNTVIKEQAHLAAKNEKIVFDDGNLKEAWINNWTSKADANIHEAADKYARYVTFQDDSFLAGWSIGAKKLMNMDREFFKSKDGKPQLWGGVIKRPHSLMAGEYILPYPRVPANLLNRGLAYSPAGFLKGALQLATGARQVEGGLYREGLLSITRSLIGTGMGALVYKLAELGLVSGSEKDESWAAQEVRRQVTGEGRNQINSTGIVRWVESGFDPKAAGKRKGDNFVTYDWAQPLALSAAFMVNAEQSMSTHSLQKKKYGLGGAKVGSALLSGMKGAYGVIEDQPMLQGVRTLFRSYGDDSGSSLDGLIRVAESVPASFVPVMVNNVTKYLDNDRKITHVPDSPLHTSINKAIARIPFMSDGLTKMYKTLGEDVPSEAYAQGNNTFFNVFLNPSFITEYNPDPIAIMLLEPYEETRNTSTLPKLQGRSLEMGGETFILETEDRATMQRIMAGHLTRAMKREAKNDPRTPAGKEAQIERLVAKVKASANQAKGWFARNRMADYLGGYDSSPEVRRKINKAKKRYKYQGKR